MPSQDFDLTDVVTAALEARLQSVYTTMPGRVDAYDEETQTITVAPLITEPGEDEAGDPVNVRIAPIQHTPVRFPGSGANRLTFPIRVGDVVQIESSHAPLGKWKTLGGEVDPGETHRHALGDAVASPGMPDGPHVPTSAPTDAVVLHTDVKVKLGGPTGTNPVLTTSDGAVFMAALDAAITASSLNAPGAAALTALKTALETALWPTGSSKVEAQ